MTRKQISSALIALGSVCALAAAQAPSALAGTVQAASPLAKSSNSAGATPAAAPVEFSVGLNPAAGAQSFATAVSTPGSASYRQFLTPAEWEARFSPSEASVRAVKNWLKEQGLTVESVSRDRLTVYASGTAAAVARAFGTSFGEYHSGKRVVRLASSALTVPSSVAGLISGVSGVDENIATPDHVTEAAAPAVKKSKEEVPQPAGFRNAKPCSTYYGEQLDTLDPPFGDGYPSPLPYAPCGYVPSQFQSAYGLSGPISEGIDGKGVSVAVVDAYESPTLLADAIEFSQKNQPTQVLSPSQFSEPISTKYNDIEECEASGWYGEQTLDVEAVHGTAPGANIVYVPAKNCANGLFQAVQQVVDGHLAQIITDSWGDNGGDLLDSPGVRKSFDNVLLMAIGTGIGVQFSSGDEGDQYINFGTDIADYPPSSPYQTAVGGTSLQVGSAGQRLGELGWSTSKSILCTAELAALKDCPKGKVGDYIPKAPGAYLYGGGGGTSYEYPEPAYQEAIVPAALADKNSALTRGPNRVDPDISMDADPGTGMLVGETQTFPDGVYYDQYRIGGTSVSSPLFAGVMADADQAAGGALGFVNPLLYALAGKGYGTTFYDVTPQPLQAIVRRDYVDGVDANEGIITSVRTLEYEGKVKYCPAEPAGAKCTSEKVSLSTAPGFDSMTGIGTPGSGLIAALGKG